MKYTLLIAETNKYAIDFIKKSLSHLSNRIDILNIFPKNGNEMYDIIVENKPDIVITNEKKSDFVASDIIKKIQHNPNLKQPYFILTSGYPDIFQIVFMKDINVYCMKKPFDYSLIAKKVENIIETSTEIK